MTTKMFLIAVLGSNMFWFCMALFSLIGSALTIRYMAPTTHQWLTKGEKEAKRFGNAQGAEVFDIYLSTILVLIHLFFWWVFAVVWLFILFSRNGFILLGLLFRGIFSCIDKVIPNISIKVEKRKD